MKRREELIKEVEQLEQKIAHEEKEIVKTAVAKLSDKFSENDSATIDIQEKIILKQELDFKALGLVRASAIKKLNTVLNDLFGLKFTNAHSEHWALFSALSNSDKKISKVLEIGTANGATTAILALLFPNSEIVTIDLPDNNDTFQGSYSRKNNINEYLKNRNQLLNKFENITFIEVNSINLGSWADKSFDLIWVDGAHGYPVLPIDLFNSCRLIKKNGFIAVDDVFVKLRKNDDMYRSTAAIQSLRLFKEANLIQDFKLIRKRLSLKYNLRDLNEKYLGVIEF